MDFKGKCAGNCCTDIVVSGFTHADLREAYLGWLRQETTFTGPSGTFPMIQDIFFLFPMLKPKGYDAGGREVYSCKHYDQPSGLCTIYEFRPTMCRNYPQTKCPCQGCTVEPT